jgi:hypothetical protein
VTPGWGPSCKRGRSPASGSNKRVALGETVDALTLSWACNM